MNSILGVHGPKEHNGIKNRQETLVLLRQEGRSLMIPLLVAKPRERSVEALPLKRDDQDSFRGRNRQHLVSRLNLQEFSNLLVQDDPLAKPSSILNQTPSPISDRHDYLRMDDYLRRKRPDDPALVQENLVRALQMVEDMVHRLILALPRKALEEPSSSDTISPSESLS